MLVEDTNRLTLTDGSVQTVIVGASHGEFQHQGTVTIVHRACHTGVEACDGSVAADVEAVGGVVRVLAGGGDDGVDEGGIVSKVQCHYAVAAVHALQAELIGTSGVSVEAILGVCHVFATGSVDGARIVRHNSEI